MPRFPSVAVLAVGVLAALTTGLALGAYVGLAVAYAPSSPGSVGATDALLAAALVASLAGLGALMRRVLGGRGLAAFASVALLGIAAGAPAVGAWVSS